MSEIAQAKSLAIERKEESKTLFGFWVYLMTDCVLFACLFATYAVLRNNTFGGPVQAMICSAHPLCLQKHSSY